MVDASGFPLDDPVDVVVIGTGAGGGNVIRELCLNGISVVALEAGPRYDPERDFENDEWTMFNRLSSFDVVVPAGSETSNFAVWSCKTVGGSTVHWTGNALRAQDHELRAASEFGVIDGTSLVDWPVTIEELAPWYAAAERVMGVTGMVQPAQVPNANYRVLERGCDALGWKIRATNMAVNATGPFDGRAQCTQRGHCMQGCSNGAMWSTLTEAIPKAEKTGWLELRTGCQAISIDVDDDGRATGVTYARGDGSIETQRAAIVVVAGNSVNTPRLLLSSDLERFPEGLANSSGQVGKNFMHHVTGTAFARMPYPVHAYKGITTNGMIDQFAGNDPEARGFVGGLNFVTVSMGMAAMSIFAQPGPGVSRSDRVGNWGSDLTELMESYTNLAGIHFIGEDMPQASNSVTLHPTQKDALGIPVAVLTYDDHANNLAMREFGYARAREIFEAAGAEKVYLVPPFPDTHLLGTCRMGDDPSTSVVNRYGQAHDVSNLFIADGSVFPTATSENPSLTISALAIRQAHHIMERMAEELE